MRQRVEIWPSSTDWRRQAGSSSTRTCDGCGYGRSRHAAYKWIALGCDGLRWVVHVGGRQQSFTVGHCLSSQKCLTLSLQGTREKEAVQQRFGAMQTASKEVILTALATEVRLAARQRALGFVVAKREAEVAEEVRQSHSSLREYLCQANAAYELTPPFTH